MTVVTLLWIFTLLWIAGHVASARLWPDGRHGLLGRIGTVVLFAANFTVVAWCWGLS